MSRYDYEFDTNSESIAARVVRLVGYDKRVLELGCSSGHMSKVFRSHGCQVIGLEMDAIAADAAREFCEIVYEVNLDDANWSETIINQAKFDVIVVADVLEHLREPRACIAQLRRLLSDDGMLVVSTPNIAHGGVIASLMQGDFRYRDTGLLDRTHIHFFTEKSLREVFVQEDFSIDHFDAVDADTDHPEFAQYWKEIPDAIRDQIKRIPNAMAFQFVVGASKFTNDSRSDALRETQRQFEFAKRSILAIQDHAKALEVQCDKSHSEIVQLSQRNEDNLVLQQCLNAEIEHLNQHTAAQEIAADEVIESHKLAVQNLRAEQRHLQEELHRTQDALHAILQTSSWRVTAPLRYVFRRVPLSAKQVIRTFLFRSYVVAKLCMLGPSKGWPELSRLIRRRAAPWFGKPGKALIFIDEKLKTMQAAAIPEAARVIEIDYSASVPFKFVLDDGIENADKIRLAAVIHLFYEDLAAEFHSYLSNSPLAMDLYISTTDDFKADVISRAFKGWTKGTVEVRVVANRGRDIAPKIITFRDVYQKYDYVLCLHGKRSHHASVLSPWRHFLLESLIGTPAVVKSVLYAFETNPQLGMISSQHFEPMRHWTNWGGNFKFAKDLANKMGFLLEQDDPLDFPSGSMFWVRSTALSPLLNLQLELTQFDEESGQTDGTFAHAVERIFFHICEHAGFDWMKIARPEIFDHTPAIIELENGQDLQEFSGKYGFKLLHPQGVKPRQTHPAPVALTSDSLFNYVRDRMLGVNLTVNPNTRVAIGLLTYNNPENELKFAVAAARCSLETAGLAENGKLFVLDNGTDTSSCIESNDFVQRQASLGNIGFGAGHNQLMRTAFAEGFDTYIAINPDGALHPEAVKALMQMLQAASGRAIIEALQFPSEHPKPYDEHTLDTPWVSGACLVIPKEAFEDLGGFDDEFFMYCEDVDLSWRARAQGYALKTCPRALFLHAVTNREMRPATLKMIFESALLLARKWGSVEFEQDVIRHLSAQGFTIPEGSPEQVPEEWRRYADFSHQFSFSLPRW